MAISFIHTADWQIGKAFGNITGDTAALLRAQRIKTIQSISRLAAERNVDAVLVAGDVFETNLVTNETIYKLLHAMESFNGPWVLIPGNHDPGEAVSVWQRIESLGCPDNVHIKLDSTPIPLADGRLVLLSACLKRKHEFEDLTAVWDSISTNPDCVRVGLAHGSVEGQLPSVGEETNPIAADRDVKAQLDYLALGDWHGTVQISDRCWYSGTPEPDRFKDNDAGNVLLVTIAGHRATPTVERMRVANYIWLSLTVQINNNDDLAALEAKFTSLGEPFDQHVVSIKINGVIDFGLLEQVDRLLSRWRGRFTWLGDDRSLLIAQPTDADLDRVDTGGIVRVAMERLRNIHSDASHPSNNYAVSALQLLYQIHTAEVTEK